jgi:hypothetical protein
LQNALILRNLLGGVSERTLVRDERQQRKNSKESYYAAVSELVFKIASLWEQIFVKRRRLNRLLCLNLLPFRLWPLSEIAFF